ncbi:hypothetical protein THAOC_35898 [Thalassiosira oceanica]|uniref:Uncharacterized protein n=1 Tax=Thalassiosira oceanica TaxID=159749 RepID=K0R995_THAOC|nr:hypothetical protein THAOC_35898 [Thalassiosira oceanica]|eukprot:EJK45486.1 hypothetical protein THAOC_35898 [Thalassiosira oceanica]
MSELDHLRKKPPDDGGLLLDTKDRRLKRECQECGVKFYIGPEETSQQASARRATLRRSINAAKKKRQRVAEKGGEREQVRLQKQALRQDLHRHAERLKMHGNHACKLIEPIRNRNVKQRLKMHGKHACKLIEPIRNRNVKQRLKMHGKHACKLIDDRAYKESKREAETKDARTTRLQGQAKRQQCMRDNIVTSETAENRLKRLQNEDARKKASRAMSPVRSQESSDSDVVMIDVDSSSSDESSDESMNDNIQMTSDTSSHSKLPGMLTDKLEVDQKVESALKHLILRTLNGDGSHSMPVCVVCDQFIIGVEEVCSISKEILQKNKAKTELAYLRDMTK